MVNNTTHMIRVIPVFKQIEQKMETKKDKKEKRKEKKGNIYTLPVYTFVLSICFYYCYIDG